MLRVKTTARQLALVAASVDDWARRRGARGRVAEVDVTITETATGIRVEAKDGEGKRLEVVACR